MSKHRNKTYRRVTVCKDCNGNGFILVNQEPRSGSYEKFICETCLGSGILSLKIEVTYTPFIKGTVEVVKLDTN